jgi:hypothetical protein
MIRRLTLLMAGIIALGSCDKEPVQPAEIPVSQTVQFQVSLGADYSAPEFDGLKAELKLSIAKENTSSGQITRLWDTTFALRDIRSYPQPAQALILSRSADRIFPSREVLRVSRTIKYVDASNRIVQEAFGETVPGTTTLKQVLVKL